MAELASMFQPPANMASLPAGMRNNNPGNIKYNPNSAKFLGAVGPSKNTDQGDPQIVFDTPEHGMRAMYMLAKRKYDAGNRTANDLIAGAGAWTPNNYGAAANIARTAGLAPNADLQLNTPEGAKKFMRGLLMQEHGDASNAYTDDQLAAAIGGAQDVNTMTAGASPATAPGQGGLPPASALADLFQPQQDAGTPTAPNPMNDPRRIQLLSSIGSMFANG